MENIYKIDKEIKFKVICHTSSGDSNDVHGRYYEKGKEYDAILEPRGNCGNDSKNEIFTSVCVKYNDGFGGRFTVVGNIYLKNKPIWGDFRTLFYCPMDMERRNKIFKILRRINNEKQICIGGNT